jgi:hypothetical protein
MHFTSLISSYLLVVVESEAVFSINGVPFKVSQNAIMESTIIEFNEPFFIKQGVFV